MSGEPKKYHYTKDLCDWVSTVTIQDFPADIKTRAKYLILDGLACGLVGAHLPWSEKAVRTMFDIESPGDTVIFGWEKKLSPLASALLNSTFIQGFELDDWHSEAPLHSNSILLPALLAAVQHAKSKTGTNTSGLDFLRACLVGYEVGPRVGRALHGAHILTTGWHSGAVFGPAAAASAVGSLFRLSADQIEDACGIACTQACGLMSAQFGSEVKRMQHGFAARNGLLGAFLAQNGYVGIKDVFEQEYGGFLKQFSLGNGKTPQYLPEELTKDLGSYWQTNGVRVKPYSSMAGTHPTVDCVRDLQLRHPKEMREGLKNVKRITIELGEAAFHHGGWKAVRPLTSTGAQMSNAFVAATQMVHCQVMPAQFRHDMLEDEETWQLVNVTTCVQSAGDKSLGRQRVEVEFHDGLTISSTVESARGVNPALSNEEVLEKWRLLTKDVIDPERARKIETFVLNLESCQDVSELQELMQPPTQNPIA